MMRGRVRRPRRLVVEPLHVVARRSSDIIALDDAEVATSLQFIQDYAVTPMGIDDVVQHVQLSRRALEIRFRRAVGRTIRMEIERVRIERAKRLLVESELPITKVAAAAGFSTASYFVQVFCRDVGVTPARYRVRVRMGGG